ncbi:LysR family transcriptional regulator [Massilia jejuensis]|uniref:LysR family transcriptional regulator n=1 Tax=Massilia jejuensis TaxID=648894 RepID=A0ABW0PDF8_9BURK
MEGPLHLGNGHEASGASMSLESPPLRARNLRISLKQWKMFHAVIDSGGFFSAADSLHVTQSTVSHAVAKLQEQLGVSLLELKGRKAHITAEGKVLLERSRDLVRNAMELEELAENIRQGWGPEIRLAMEPSFPPELLTLALRTLSSFPQKIRLSVREAAPDQIKAVLQDYTVELAISSRIPVGCSGKHLIDIEHIAVAHPDNPLFALKRNLGLDDLKTQFQIAISGSNDYIASEASRRLPRYERPWNVSSAERAVGMMRHGFGYAWLPAYQTKQWLEENQLRILPLAGGASYQSSLFLVAGRPPAADSAVTAFANALHSCSERFFKRR